MSFFTLVSIFERKKPVFKKTGSPPFFRVFLVGFRFRFFVETASRYSQCGMFVSRNQGIRYIYISLLYGQGYFIGN